MEFLLLRGLIAWKSSFGSIRVLSTRTGVQDSPYTLIVFMRDMLTDRSAKSWLALENLARRVCRGLPSLRPLCTGTHASLSGLSRTLAKDAKLFRWPWAHHKKEKEQSVPSKRTQDGDIFFDQLTLSGLCA